MHSREMSRTMLRAASAAPVHPGILDAAPCGPYHAGRGGGPCAIASVPWPRTRDGRPLDPSGFSPSHRAARPAPSPAVLRRLAARFRGARHVAASRELRRHRCSEDEGDVSPAGRENSRLLPALPLRAVGPPVHRVNIVSLVPNPSRNVGFATPDATPRWWRRAWVSTRAARWWGWPATAAVRRATSCVVVCPVSASSRPDRVTISPYDLRARGTAQRAPIASRRRRFIESIPGPHIVVPALAETERIAFESPHKE